MERIEKLKQFLKATPGDSFLQHALALEYIKLNEDRTARLLFEEILTREPEYVGSYYHLVKLLERAGLPELSADWRQKGMQQARSAGDQHAYNELQGALEDIDD